MPEIFSHIYTEEERVKRFSAEKKRLAKTFEKMSPDKMKIVEGLIEQTARMRVMITELNEIIARDGYIEAYKNGENQFGVKKSAAVDVYDKTVNTYSKVIKQLCDLLPDEAAAGPGAALMEFINK